jgi:4a-hydroxytetrahydrobiopterin dehydratase
VADSGGELHDRRCTPCRKGTPPLDAAAVAALLPRLSGWAAPDSKRLEKEYRFKDFKSALAYVDRIGAIADAEDHHPDIRLSWGKVGVVLWTHAAGGLTENDFILAAKFDRAV